MQDGRLLVVRHLNHLTGRAYWWLPGGGLNAGETPQDCVIREIREETHLEVNIERLLLETHDPSRKYTYERYVTYLCNPIGGELAPGSEHESSVMHSITGLVWYPLWDEKLWDEGFYEEHLYSLLKMIQAALKPI